MADQKTEQTDVPAPAPASDVTAAPSTEDKKPEEPETASADVAKSEDKPAVDEKEESKEDTTEKTEKAVADDDTEMADAGDKTVVDADQTQEAVTTGKTPSKASSNNRRKSGGGAANRKTLSKKASKARITHLDAKPGDYFLVKLKGFPEWPAIVCDESMLPQALLTTRPVTAARPDGSYADNYADGAKRVNDRTFPVMYLHTNEFGWVVNTALTELTAEQAANSMEGKIRKDLKAAFELASEQHPLSHYKDILQKFEEELIAQEEAKKVAAATPKKSKKAKAKETEDDDVDMADAEEGSKAKSKKRKAEDAENTPQRSDSVKKPKIKLNTSSTPKAANGTAAPAKGAAATSSKAKGSKAAKAEAKTEAAAEAPKPTPEQVHERKEREVLYLRHKLQRGFLSADNPPQEGDMPLMNDHIANLEGLEDLDLSIMRTTKIHKVLRAIIKLESIPLEEKYNIKSRSRAILASWSHILNDQSSTAATEASTNGAVNGAKKAAESGTKAEKKADVEKPTEKPTEKASKSVEPEKADSKSEAPKENGDSSEKAAPAPEAVESAA